MIELQRSELLIADKILGKFSENMKKFWELFYLDQSTDDPVNLLKFDHRRLSGFKPHFWSGTLIFDEDNTICDLEMTFIGENLAQIYGQRKGQYMINNYGDNSFRTDFPTYHYRFKTLIEALVDTKKPLLTMSKYKDGEDRKITVNGLVLPVSGDGKSLDCIYGFVEVDIEVSER